MAYFTFQKIIQQVKRTQLFLSSMFAVNEVGNVFQVLFSCDFVVVVKNINKFKTSLSTKLLEGIFFSCDDDFTTFYAVKSKELVWLPNGSEFPLESQDSKTGLSSKPKTYTSFTCSQDSLPEFSGNPISPALGDILIARLGPGQVNLLVVLYNSGHSSKIWCYTFVFAT